MSLSYNPLCSALVGSTICSYVLYYFELAVVRILAYLCGLHVAPESAVSLSHFSCKVFCSVFTTLVSNTCNTWSVTLVSNTWSITLVTLGQ